LFQKGEHTLAKVEHRAVLALLEAINVGLSQPGGGDEGHDVYIDTLVNLHRSESPRQDKILWAYPTECFVCGIDLSF